MKNAFYTSVNDICDSEDEKIEWTNTSKAILRKNRVYREWRGGTGKWLITKICNWGVETKWKLLKLNFMYKFCLIASILTNVLGQALAPCEQQTSTIIPMKVLYRMKDLTWFFKINGSNIQGFRTVLVEKYLKTSSTWETDQNYGN